MSAGHSRNKNVAETNTYTSALKSDTPSPAAYNVRVRASSPRFTMKSRIPPLKPQAERTHISPCTYEQDIRPKHEGPKFSMSHKHNTLKCDDNPGPGYYSPNYATTGSESSIRLSGRTGNTAQFFKEKNAKFIPSPDAYFVKRKITKVGYVFGSDARSGANIKSTSPGPAYINVSDSFKKTMNTGRKASFAGRIESIQEKEILKGQNIGPGSYNLPSRMNFSGGCTISGRTKMVVTLK